MNPSIYHENLFFFHTHVCLQREAARRHKWAHKLTANWDELTEECLLKTIFLTSLATCGSSMCRYTSSSMFCAWGSHICFKIWKLNCKYLRLQSLFWRLSFSISVETWRLPEGAAKNQELWRSVTEKSCFSCWFIYFSGHTTFGELTYFIQGE